MGQKKIDFLVKVFFFFKNELLPLFLIKINRIYSNKEKLCQKIQNTSDNFKNCHIFYIFSNYLKKISKIS
jgi:hypothetical protein